MPAAPLQAHQLPAPRCPRQALSGLDLLLAAAGEAYYLLPL